MTTPQFSTGLAGLDRVFKGLLPGDNLVWQVESLDDFAPLAAPYCRWALAQGRKVIYFRFADHPSLVPADLAVEVRRLETSDGFERFIAGIHQGIQEGGRGAYFVFDCLSTLAEAWCSDSMLGNFFMLTCPYVYDRESIAYFPLLRDTHSFHALKPIADTTQILVDIYRHRDKTYIHPTKVQHRYSATMYMLHAWDGDVFVPVTESSTIAEILTTKPWAGLESVRLRLGKWNRSFLRAEEAWEDIQRGRKQPGEVRPILQELLYMALSRDDRVMHLIEEHLTLPEVLGIWKRMIGTGLIGGKSVGMLLARSILNRSDPRWNDLLEAHDSFFIGSDVFYSFLVENGCWWLRQRQRNRQSFLDDVEEARRRVLMGSFPDYIIREYSQMLDYFGQSPIIVRSSSLLEDAYGNAFAGKYESVFCANQGPHQKRLDDFMSAVKTIYASTMSEKALRYRAQRGLLEKDEQMSLLVQRVSGIRYGSLFYPQVAGVGLSRNPYVWNPCIDPAAGVLRLVFGLGTRAVDRSDDDYTRVVALNDPERRPEGGADEVRQYSQRRVDVIDLEAGQLASYDFADVAGSSPGLPIGTFASEDRELAARAAERGTTGEFHSILTFGHLLSQTPFVGDMRQMLAVLQQAYDYPVDIEFTANFFGDDQYRINLVQCRPLQIAAGREAVDLPSSIPGEDLLLEAHGAVIGQSRLTNIDRVVYVTPSVYGQLPIRDRYSVARLIGRVLHLEDPRGQLQVMLIGPGRWGTSTPSLGVPVAFAEIDTISVLCEIVTMNDDLIPDVSLGTHFFNDLVEMDVLYLALFPKREGSVWNRPFFEQSPNRLVELIPGAAPWSEVVRVIDLPSATDPDATIQLNANAMAQTVVCYRNRNGKASVSAVK